jgi:hypothetical protein
MGRSGARRTGCGNSDTACLCKPHSDSGGCTEPFADATCSNRSQQVLDQPRFGTAVSGNTRPAGRGRSDFTFDSAGRKGVPGRFAAEGRCRGRGPCSALASGAGPCLDLCVGLFSCRDHEGRFGGAGGPEASGRFGVANVEVFQAEQAQTGLQIEPAPLGRFDIHHPGSSSSSGPARDTGDNGRGRQRQ